MCWTTKQIISLIIHTGASFTFVAPMKNASNEMNFIEMFVSKGLLFLTKDLNCS